MISSIEGKIEIIGEDFISIKTPSGVGYMVFVKTNLLSKLSILQEIKFFIETIVKEDSISLYGFETFSELVWFKSLIKVSGIGPKLALTLLSFLQVKDIISAIETEDKKLFTTVSGIGEKVATRIITEMKKEPKKNLAVITSTMLEKKEEIFDALDSKKMDSTLIADAIMALEALGFNRGSIYQVVSNVINENKSIQLQDVIKLSLKHLKGI